MNKGGKTVNFRFLNQINVYNVEMFCFALKILLKYLLKAANSKFLTYKTIICVNLVVRCRSFTHAREFRAVIDFARENASNRKLLIFTHVVIFYIENSTEKTYFHQRNWYG